MNYVNSNFEEDFAYFVNEDNLQDANRVLMTELGRILVKQKSDFVDLLNESFIPANNEMSDAQLVNLFVDNVRNNKHLKIGAAMLVNHHNKSVGFDGETEINDDAVKDAYDVLFSYFGDHIPPDAFPDEEETSNFAWGQAIGGAVSKGAEFGQKIYEGERRKKYGALDDALAEREAKRQMMASIMEQRRKQQEIEQQKLAAKQKTTKTVLIVGGAVLGLTVIGVLIYKLRKK